jgi:hypothetical protein
MLENERREKRRLEEKVGDMGVRQWVAMFVWQGVAMGIWQGVAMGVWQGVAIGLWKGVAIGAWQGVAMDSLKFHPARQAVLFYALREGHP